MDIVRFGIIGLGGMGSHHVNYFNSLENARLTALCDINPQKLARHTEKTGLPGYSSATELITRADVDAVLIATPHYDHGPIARLAFQHGKHVLSEKPAAVSVRDARQTNDAWRQTDGKCKYGIMFQMRGAAPWQKLRSLIAEGELGQLQRLTWIVTDWFRTHAYYASGGWRATWAGEGGGVLINQCPHNLDLLWWTTGLMPSRVTAVGFVGKTHPIEVEDEISAILEYPNGAIGHFVTATGEAPGTNRFEIVGEMGKIIVEHGKIMFHRNRKSSRVVNETSSESFAHVENWPIEIPLQRVGGDHKFITQNFVNHILRGDKLLCPGVEGVNGLELGNAMQMSGLLRKPVDLPIDGEEYDRFIKEMTQKYGGRKTVKASTEATSDLGASFKS